LRVFRLILGVRPVEASAPGRGIEPCSHLFGFYDWINVKRAEDTRPEGP
jgi:hypothetical protein